MPLLKKIDEEIELSALPDEPPEELTPPAKAIYKKVLPLLKELKAVACDIHTIISYCQVIATKQKALMMLNIQGEVIYTSKGDPIINPWQTIFRTMVECEKKIANDICTSPGARARLGITITQKDPSDDINSLADD